MNIFQDCSKYKPSSAGIFTNVGKYVQWITEEMEDDQRRNGNENGSSIIGAKITINLIICAFLFGLNY